MINQEIINNLPAWHPLYLRLNIELNQDIIKAKLVQAVQSKLDQEAMALGYDNIFTAVTYINDNNQKFATEGLAFKTWRSAVWTYCYQVFADVVAGTRSVPSIEELLAELPTLNIIY